MLVVWSRSSTRILWPQTSQTFTQDTSKLPIWFPQKERIQLLSKCGTRCLHLALLHPSKKYLTSLGRKAPRDLAILNSTWSTRRNVGVDTRIWEKNKFVKRHPQSVFFNAKCHLSSLSSGYFPWQNIINHHHHHHQSSSIINHQSSSINHHHHHHQLFYGLVSIGWNGNWNFKPTTSSN